MQNSDVYIGLRPPNPALSDEEREAIVSKAVRGVHTEEGFSAKATPVVLGSGANQRVFIFACRYFALERLNLMAPTMMLCNGKRFFVLSLIEGACTVVYGDHHEPLRPGNTVLLPASLGPVTLVPTQPSAFLKAYVPDLVEDVIKPLRVAGVVDEAIVGLGGKTALNDLARLVSEGV